MFDDRILTAEALPFLWPLALCAVVAYLVGAVPWGWLLAAMAGHGDLRRRGSGNIGATNALRTGGRALAAATLVLDAGKGALATIAGYRVGGPDFAVAAALAVVLGHMFPVWLRFRGGKGVATTLGLTLGLAWLPGLLCCLAWLAVAGATRVSSLAGMASAVAAPVALWFVARDAHYAQAATLIALAVLLRHHANLRRLLKGEEPRIGRGP